MRRGTDGGLLYSPSDLVVFLRSPFASWMDRLRLERPGEADPDEETESERLIADKGIKHEEAWLATIERGVGKLVAIDPKGAGDAFADTVTALAAGPGVIYQAALRARLGGANFAGYADFLERADGASTLGAFHYEVVDTKLARSPKPYFLIQLCCYADMLQAAQGVRPAHIHVVLGTNERHTFRTDDYHYTYLTLRDAFLDLMRTFDPAQRPAPDPAADHGRWTSYAERWAEQADHLSRVANITSGQVRKLEAAGITTRNQLASTTLPRVTKLAEPVYTRLRAQARLQVASVGLDVPAFEIVPATVDEPRRGLASLPPSSALDVWADFEGFPLVDGGLEYLFGATTHDAGARAFHDWWAHDSAEEKRAFEGFVDFLHARWRRDATMHVFHYAAYEVTALRRLMGRHATRENEVDDLLRAQVFVDLYNVVRQGVRVGTDSYSIKAIERLYRPARAGDVVNAGDSIVAYHAFRESGQPRDWRQSPLLEGIRAYNKDDCDSTLELAQWLWARQAGAGIRYLPVAAPEAEAGADADADAAREPTESDLGAALAAELLAAQPPDGAADDWRRVNELLAYLVEFHRREQKPVYWLRFERSEMSHEELADDINCLGAMHRESATPEAMKRSFGWWYSYDLGQDTKFDEGDKCLFAHDLEVRAHVDVLDRVRGRVRVKVGPKYAPRIVGGVPPAVLALIPDEGMSQKPLQQAIRCVAEKWRGTGELSPHLDALLRRGEPRVRGHCGGALLNPGEDLVSGSVRIVGALDRSTLCVQGPPGTGKTHTAAKMILALIAAGKRVGITATSHAVIENLMAKCGELAGPHPPRAAKVGRAPTAALLQALPGVTNPDSADAADRVATYDLVGGTAWFFSRPDVEGAFDHLFVDEAGQVSLANVVAVSGATANLVLVGDQMQLGQPMRGSHPGESGSSALEYLLENHATIPDDLGIFLAETWRLHPGICGFISGAVYEDRLKPRPVNVNRVVRVPRTGASRVASDAGMVFIPVDHDGNTQASDEEVAVIAELFTELVGRDRTDATGTVVGKMTVSDILVVAPYNMQVRRLAQALPDGAKIGSVDRFQGQEAAVVIVSMCASDGESSARGIEFLFDKHRLNVAISRAQSLALVVASPALVRTRCSTVGQLALVNTFCRIVAAGTPARPPT